MSSCNTGQSRRLDWATLLVVLHIRLTGSRSNSCHALTLVMRSYYD